MKNKKKAKAVEPQFLAQGIYKKRVFPWLVVIAAILAVAALVAYIAFEFYNAPKCIDHKCDGLFNYCFHYNTPLMIACIAALVLILLAIILPRKRTLTVTASTLTYKKGRKVVNIDINSIQNIDTGASSVLVTVPHVKFKFAGLKNKKEIYDVLFTQINASVASNTATIPTQSLTVMASPMLTNPTLQGKLAYFKKLHDSGLISGEQYDKYIAQSFKADSAK